MLRLNKFVKNHPDLFTFQKAEKVHPHDHFMERVFLRFVPKSITPNIMTTSRIILTPIVFYFILTNHYVVGMILFLFAAFTDALDGSMARTRGQITKFGMLYDPLADKLLIGSLILLVVFSNFNFWLGFVLLGIEILFMVTALVAKVKFKTVHMANIWGKIKMMLQVSAVFLTLGAVVLNFPILLSVAAGLFGLAIGFAVVSLFAHGV